MARVLSGLEQFYVRHKPRGWSLSMNTVIAQVVFGAYVAQNMLKLLCTDVLIELCAFLLNHMGSIRM